MVIEKIIINAFGTDKPGIVSNISGMIASIGGNIENSKMVRIETMFTVIMIVTIPQKNKKLLLKHINKIEGLNSVINNIRSSNSLSNYKKYNFLLECIDNEGIIHHFTKYLNQKKINIEEMNTSTINAPITGSTLFNLESIICIPKDLDINKLKSRLNILSEKYNVNYRLLLFESK